MQRYTLTGLGTFNSATLVVSYWFPSLPAIHPLPELCVGRAQWLDVFHGTAARADARTEVEPRRNPACSAHVAAAEKVFILDRST